MEESDFSFSFPDARDLPDKITPQEILSVFNNKNSSTEPRRQYEGTCYYMIGFSAKKRFLQLFLNYTEGQIAFLQARVSDEDDIITGYCGKQIR